SFFSVLGVSLYSSVASVNICVGICVHSINDKCCCHIMACHKFAFVSITHLSILCVRSLAFSSLTHTLRFSRPVNGGEASTTKSATQAIVTGGIEWMVKRKVPWLKGGRGSVNINDKSEYRHLKNGESIIRGRY
uniref:Uncharacterized protein n=1 Tax=Glossina palpalis gambiensis TaxID=67801 RepID=A0A1B0AU52_9MUSC